VAVLVLSFAPQVLMPRILQCDLEGVQRVLAGLEADPATEFTIEAVQKILDERADGGRNIVHALVAMCQPTSNKENDEPTSSSATLHQSQQQHQLLLHHGVDSVESIVYSSRAMNLRDMVRRAAAASRLDLPPSSSSVPPSSQSASAAVAASAASASSVPLLGPPGDASPPSLGAAADESPSMPSLGWPPEPMEASAASGDEDSLLGLANASALHGATPKSR
jgi:E3 ubiquitin-protein ligase EDD1